MGNDLILSIDIGTSAAKVILFDGNLRQVGSSHRYYPTQTPRPGWSEQNPDRILTGCLEAIRDVMQAYEVDRQLAGVVFSSQMYSVLAVDPGGRPITPSLTWLDTRSVRITEKLRLHPLAAQVNQITGCPIDAIYPLSKVGWLAEHYQLARDTRFISIKEYILYRLTGWFIADWSTASSSGMMDIRHRTWDPAALSLAGLSAENLSVLASPRTVLSEWLPEIPGITGIPLGTPLVLGGGDGPLASLGVGAITSDILAVNVGTSAAARCTLPQPLVDPDGRLWTYVADEDLWVMGGMVSSGGVVYDWFIRNFGISSDLTDTMIPETDRQIIERLAAAVPPGSEGLLFIPYLGGEQCPVWHPYTRGGFFGLDFSHGRGHLARAVLEGITRSIYWVAETIQSVLGSEFKEMRITGGLGESPLWQQIAADLVGLPVMVSDSPEGSARGAALLGWVSLGQAGSIQDLLPSPMERMRILPREDVHRFYKYQQKTFVEILDSIRNVTVKYQKGDQP